MRDYQPKEKDLRQMKILKIGTTDKTGGAARISWILKTELEKSGHHVSMFVADKTSSDPNVKIIPRSKWRKYLGFLLGTERLINTDWILKTKEFKDADIIHCHNLHGRFFNLETLAKMSKEKPVVWTLHDEWAITPHCACTMESRELKHGLYSCPSIDIPPRTLWNNDRRLANWKKRVYSESQLHLVTPSFWLKNRIINTVLAKQDIRYIANGIDTSVFKPESKFECRNDLGLPQDKKIVLFLADNARKNPWKGWEYAEALAKSHIDDPSIIFVSVGNYDSYSDEKNIINRGRITNNETLAKYYNAADILLFTSLAENMPLVILEATSCGLPIVSFDVGGVKEVVTHGQNGFIANYRDQNSLNKEFLKAAAFPTEKREELKLNATKRIQGEYDQQTMVEKYFELYGELTRSSETTI